MTSRRRFAFGLTSLALLGRASEVRAATAKVRASLRLVPAAFVPCSDIGALAIVDLRSGSLSGYVAVGTSPSRAIADKSRERIFVSNFADDSISVVDTRARLVTAAYATEQGPSTLALDGARRRLYVCNVLSESVSVLDADSGKLLARAACGKHPNGIVLNAVLDEAYVVGSEPDVLTIVTWTGDSVVTRPVAISGAVDAVALDATGKFAFASDATRGTVSTIDLTSRTVTSVVRGLATPQSMALAEDGRTLYVAESASATVAIVDLRGSAVVARIPTAASPYVIRWDKAAGLLFAVGFEGDAITLIDPQRRSVVRTLGGLSKPRDIAIGVTAG